MDIAELHSQALDATKGVIAGVRQGQWAAPTPCPGWNVRTLVNHVVAGNLWAAELAAGATLSEVGDHLDGDVLGADPLGAYDASAKAAAAVFAIPGALKAPCAVSYGPVPGAVYAGHRFIDVLIHGWDMAVATRQNTKLRPALVDACLDIVAPQAELLRASGVFGDKIKLADASDAQTRLLATLGRRALKDHRHTPSWGNDTAFAQTIECRTSNLKATQEAPFVWEDATAGKRSASRRILTRGHKRGNRYFMCGVLRLLRIGRAELQPPKGPSALPRK